MDFGILRVFEALLAAAGWKSAVGVMFAVLILVALVRLAPSWLADRRAGESERLRLKNEAQRALQARIDAKDATLEKILTNHIAHLELQLEASREFYQSAAERLAAISIEMKEARHQLEKNGTFLEEIKEDTTVLRDRHPS